MSSLLTPIVDVILKENQNIALIFPIVTKPAFTLYFFRVQRRYPLHRTYDSEMPEIPPLGTVECKFLGEKGSGEGDDILTVWEERPFRILHFGIGVRPRWVWFYKAQPADVLQTGWAYKLPTKVGEKKDYISGHLSPYDRPTVASETVLYHKTSVYLGFRNDSIIPTRPSLRFLGAGYDVLPITNRDVINAMLAGRIPCRFLTVGGLMMFTYVVPKEWEGKGIEVDQAAIEAVLTR